MTSVKSVLASLYLGSLCVFLLVAVYARPANNSAIRKEKSGISKDENEIQPPNHLNGLKLEKGGVLNKDFHQEVFLGKEMEEFEEDSEPIRNRKKLIGIFQKVDVNVDKKISASEMQRWIMEKTEEHFQQANEENKLHFKAVDPDGNGQVSWDEYRIKFLASKGFNEKEVAEKIKNNEELKIDEENQDGDKRLTVSEFISLPVGTVENQEAQDVDDDWVKERRKEFEEVIDADRDGIVTMEELEEYMDPMNEYSALNEAKQMIAVADENQDHYLELEEILKYSEYFTGSKLMNYAQSVHEEF
ncbi:45 kDa calcium-binding protein isoform X2 [Cetorhinus maximus]